MTNLLKPEQLKPFMNGYRVAEAQDFVDFKLPSTWRGTYDYSEEEEIQFKEAPVIIPPSDYIYTGFTRFKECVRQVKSNLDSYRLDEANGWLKLCFFYRPIAECNSFAKRDKWARVIRNLISDGRYRGTTFDCERIEVNGKLFYLKHWQGKTFNSFGVYEVGSFPGYLDDQRLFVKVKSSVLTWNATLPQYLVSNLGGTARAVVKGRRCENILTWYENLGLTLRGLIEPTMSFKDSMGRVTFMLAGTTMGEYNQSTFYCPHCRHAHLISSCCTDYDTVALSVHLKGFYCHVVNKFVSLPNAIEEVLIHALADSEMEEILLLDFIDKVTRGEYVLFDYSKWPGAAPHEQEVLDVSSKNPMKVNKLLSRGISCPLSCINYSGSPWGQYGTDVFVIEDSESLPTIVGTRKSSPLEPLYLGVELETEPLNPHGSLSLEELTKMCKGLDNWAIWKRDGSLNYDGREIVTLPMTLDAHRVCWEQFFKTKPHEYLSSWKSGNCGLHVHINRAGMTPLTQGKLIEFINHPDNLEFVEAIAGRKLKDHRYCKVEPDKGLLEGQSFRKDSKGKPIRHVEGNSNPDYDSRYTATNISSHTGGRTIEIRIFRGNVGRNGVMRVLEFCTSLCEFLSLNTTSIRSTSSWLDYITWLGEQTVYPRYPELYRWACFKKYLFPKVVSDKAPEAIKVSKKAWAKLNHLDSEDEKPDEEATPVPTIDQIHDEVVVDSSSTSWVISPSWAVSRTSARGF